MKLSQINQYLNQASFSATLSRLYGAEETSDQLKRWSGLAAEAVEKLPEGEFSLFSAPGRSELGGNHTDHNRGRVLAAAIQLDTITVVVPRNDFRIRILSRGYDPFDLDVSSTAPVASEKGGSASLIRGVADFFVDHGHKIGGFDAVVESTVLRGSGLSSSASFEVLIGGIFSGLYNNGSIDPIFIARAGQYAENRYMGKPCGLMDQSACAVGGVVGIDFRDPANPEIRKVELDMARAGYVLAVVDTGGNHADLTHDYASIPTEMKAIAVALGGLELRDVSEATLRAHLAELRMKVGDRAILRALHFFAENDRAKAQLEAVAAGDIPGFLALVRASGLSSVQRLQNINPSLEDGREQGIALALALTEDFLQNEGAFRVHGGGFAGTIQAWIPSGRYSAFKKLLESVFGPGRVCSLRIRSDGVTDL